MFDLIHSVNAMRRVAGIELTDRIVLTLLEADADAYLLAHRDRSPARATPTNSDRAAAAA